MYGGSQGPVIQTSRAMVTGTPMTLPTLLSGSLVSHPLVLPYSTILSSRYNYSYVCGV